MTYGAPFSFFLPRKHRCVAHVRYSDVAFLLCPTVGPGSGAAGDVVAAAVLHLRADRLRTRKAIYSCSAGVSAR